MSKIAAKALKALNPNGVKVQRVLANLLNNEDFSYRNLGVGLLKEIELDDPKARQTVTNALKSNENLTPKEKERIRTDVLRLRSNPSKGQCKKSLARASKAQ